MPPLSRPLLAMAVAFAMAAPATAADRIAPLDTPACSAPIEGSNPLRVFTRLAVMDDGALARFALPYALMARDVRQPGLNNALVYGYARGPNAPELFQVFDPSARLAAAIVGFFAGTFIHCASGTVVAVYRSTSPYDPRDLLAGIVRHNDGGYSDLALRFFDAVATQFPGQPIIVVGHSSGGGLASYVAGERGVPSVVFNGTRSPAAITNAGTQQLAIIVDGDPISDPVEAALRRDAEPQPHLNGVFLRLQPNGDYSGWRRHWISTVIGALERMID